MMSKSSFKPLLAGAIFSLLLATPLAVHVGEGGTTHVIPGAHVVAVRDRLDRR